MFLIEPLRALAFAAAFIVLGEMGIARCEPYPTRPVRILVGSAPGGAADVSARLAAEALSQKLGNPVYVELRGGAGGMNAVDSFLASEPDGYTILLAAVGSFAIIPAAKHVSYDVEKDFISLGIVWQSTQALAVRSSLGAPTLGDFITIAKTGPGQLTFGSAGTGTVTHLAMLLLERDAEIHLIHVPFRGIGQALPALVGGQIDALFTDAGAIAPRVNAGTVKALAVATTRRMPLLPDVPTMTEAGYPGVGGDVWFGLVVSAKTPPAIVKRLQDALVAMHNDPSYTERLARLHATAGAGGPEPLDQLIHSEGSKWRAVVREAGIRFD